MGNIVKKKIFTGGNSTSGLTSVVMPSLQSFRLTLTPSVPVTTTDVVAASTIYMSPYTGSQISLYDGANWVTYSTAEISLALGTITSSVGVDVFCYANSGTPTLELVEWSSSSARTTSLTFVNGVPCKTGALTRRFIGSFYNPGNKSSAVTISNATPAVITHNNHNLPLNAPVVFTNSGGSLPTGITAGTTYYVASIGTVGTNTYNISATPGGALINTSSAGSGTHTCTVPTYTEDSELNKFVWNYNNQVARRMYRTESVVSYTYGVAAFRIANGNNANVLNYFNGLAGNTISVQTHVRGTSPSAGGVNVVGLGFNSLAATKNSVDARCYIANGNGYNSTWIASDLAVSSIGLNYYSWLEYSDASGTSTFYGTSSCLKAVVIN